jgi:putative transcriptional regulator
VGGDVGRDPQIAHLMENRLPLLRAERRWSQAALAERLGVSRQTVISIERGKYDPSLPLAFRIAAVFETTIEAVFDPAP